MRLGAARATPYITFTSRNTPMTRGSPWWKKMYHHFQADWESGDENNNRRSNVESIFAAVKKMLGETLKSKNRTTQVYELLCKNEAYNITVLIHKHGHGVPPSSAPRSLPLSAAR